MPVLYEVSCQVLIPYRIDAGFYNKLLYDDNNAFKQGDIEEKTHNIRWSNNSPIIK